MRRFVADFLLPVVRGGPAHIGRPLGLDAIQRMLRDPFPIADAATLADLAACRIASARRVIPVVEPPPFDEATLRLGAALHDLLALGHPEMGGNRSRRADRVAAAALELASIGSPPTARARPRGRRPARVPPPTTTCWRGCGSSRPTAG